MPPRLSLQSAHRQCSSYISQWSACLSTTSNSAAPGLQKLRPLPKSASASLLGVDDEGSTPISSHDRVRSILNQSNQRSRRAQKEAEKRASNIENLRDQAVSEAYLRQLPRRWKMGDVYAPHDLSPQEMAKWRRPSAPKMDVCDVLGLNPMDEYRNFSMIAEYITPLGRIKHSSETGLRPVNQRKMAKAIRRAVGIGIHPSVHRHPELIRRDLQNVGRQNMPSTPKGKSPF